MRLSVNLATRPFVELRPFFFRLRLLMVFLALLGFGVALGAHVVSARAETQQIELDKLRNLTIATQKAKLQTEARLRQPANAEVLDRAHFLNSLFLRKSFSWTAVMMDLEDVLPVGVQVTSIEPAVTADGAVLIRLRVAGERDRAVQLVRNLERSHRFLQPRLGSESAQTKETGGVNGARPVSAVPLAPLGVEFEILANYNPLPAGEPFRAGHGRESAQVIPSSGLPGSERSLPSVVTSAALPSPAESMTAAERNRAIGTPPAVAAAGSGRAVRNDPGSTNVSNGFPRNGVVLPQFNGPPRPQDGRMVRPNAPNSQGGGAQ